MDTSQAVADRIIRLCAERNLAVNALARISGIPCSTLKNIVSGASKSPEVTTIKKICDGLDITLRQFFLTEEFNSLEPEIK